ncbi:Mov34/MPN/PAD-1 family protein [Sphingomonas sp. HMP6]|uniref:Mov34/MPN/PAD-1 family protein n=1 Tax=Sphingomonas sp. HMP6 TaxID=1517551 RepID=UPI0015969345|nr:M67 family metallopeptidase [Sphingomonas sp. HMP6]
MALEISSTLLVGLLNEAERSPEHEVCGLLFGTPARIEQALRCCNVAPDPRSAFEIDPVQLIAAHKAERRGGPRIVGCYHSHPSGPPLPSARDAAAAMTDGAIWLIIARREAGFFCAIENGAIERRFVAVRHEIVEP